MWINDNYYEQLLSIIKQFAKGSFDFDPSMLASFKADKYMNLTNALTDVKANAQKHIDENLEMLTSIIDGSFAAVDFDRSDTGDYGRIYDKYNSLTRHLDKMNEYTDQLYQSVTKEGKIDSRLEDRDMSGKWLEIGTKLNFILKSFSTPLHEITSIINNVARGDLSKKMRFKIDNFEISGDFLKLANTINTMVEQLSQFASEVTRVAREVGTEGLLGDNARVEGVSGTWLDLTDNVNSMADALTIQVRNIIEVAMAVANGDLTRDIDIDVKGEYLDLKNHINTMIHELSESETKNGEQNWIKDGVSLLNKQVLNQDLLSGQIQTAINQLSRYIDARIGALYLYYPEKKILKLEGCYACKKDTVREFKLGEGVIGQVALEKKPILLKHPTEYLKLETGTVEYEVPNTYTSPLVFKGELTGVLEVASYEAFTDLKIEFIESALVILSGYIHSSLREARDKKKLKDISITDSLTGLFDRRYFEETVPTIINRSKRNNNTVCFALIDIDFFKKYNDLHGHQVGDIVLKQVARVFSRYSNRADDYCFRIGGEEFCIIFNEEDRKKAFDFMTNIRKEIENLKIYNVEGKEVGNITVSIGLTCEKAMNIENLDSLFYNTDQLLYTAKETGKNKIVQNR